MKRDPQDWLTSHSPQVMDLVARYVDAPREEARALRRKAAKLEREGGAATDQALALSKRSEADTLARRAEALDAEARRNDQVIRRKVQEAGTKSASGHMATSFAGKGWVTVDKSKPAGKPVE
jgi:hypothetical protein